MPCPLCEVNRRIGLHDSNGVAHACDSDTRLVPEAVVGDVADLEAANTDRVSRSPHLRGYAVTDQHCSPRAVRTPVSTRNLNPDGGQDPSRAT